MNSFKVCGDNNCLTEYSKSGGNWGPDDDCCTRFWRCFWIFWENTKVIMVKMINWGDYLGGLSRWRLLHKVFKLLLDLHLSVLVLSSSQSMAPWTWMRFILLKFSFTGNALQALCVVMGRGSAGGKISSSSSLLLCPNWLQSE